MFTVQSRSDIDTSPTRSSFFDSAHPLRPAPLASFSRLVHYSHQLHRRSRARSIRHRRNNSPLRPKNPISRPQRSRSRSPARSHSYGSIRTDRATRNAGEAIRYCHGRRGLRSHLVPPLRLDLASSRHRRQGRLHNSVRFAALGERRSSTRIVGAGPNENRRETTEVDELASVEGHQDQPDALHLAARPRLRQRLPLLPSRFLPPAHRAVSGTAPDRSTDAGWTDSVWLRLQSRAVRFARGCCSRRWSNVVGYAFTRSLG